jgi:uncharacterized protein YybS (DUF2232 family)
LAGRWLLWSSALVALWALILFGRVSPMASLFLGTWLPLPLLLVGWRLGTGGAALLALAGALLVVVLNPALTVLQNNLGLWMVLFMALILTACHQRGWQNGSGILIAVAVLGAVSLVFFLGQAYVQGLSPLELWSEKAREFTDTLTKMLTESGITFSDLRVLGLPQVDLQGLLVQVMPALVLINLAMTAWVNVLAAQWLANLWGWDDPGDPLSQWASPEWLVFLLVAAGFSLLIPWAGLRQAGLNLLLIMGFIYFCQGMAVISAVLQRYRLPFVLRGLVYVLAFMNPLMIVVTILGLTDLWLDYRMFQPPRET